MDEESFSSTISLYPAMLVSFLENILSQKKSILGGDRVVYFPFGHKTYLDDCKKHNVYNPLSRDYPRSDLNSQEFATVEKLQYRFAPYHCVALWLNLQSGYTIKV